MILNIAIDYDGTFDRDTELWRAFIDRATANGHRCYLVTCRDRSDFDEAEFDALLEQTGLPPHRHIFTTGSAKDWFCRQRNVRIDVWIDDDPACVAGGK